MEENSPLSTRTVRPFGTPGYTQFDNVLLDHLMPSLTGSGWKVLCLAVRNTWGWSDDKSPTGRKEWDTISYSQFRKKTGIISNSTVQRALDENIEKGYLLQRQAGSQGFSYRLNTSLEIEIEDTTVTETVKDTVTETVKVDPETFTETVNTKESIKKEKETPPSFNYHIFDVGEMKEFGESVSSCPHCGENSIEIGTKECPACTLLLFWREGKLRASDRQEIRELDAPDLAPADEFEIQVLKSYGNNGFWSSSSAMRQFRRERATFKKKGMGAFFKDLFEWGMKEHVPIGNVYTGLKKKVNQENWIAKHGEVDEDGNTVIDMDPKPRVIVAEIAGFIHPERKVVLM